MPFDGIRNSALVRTLADVLEDLPDLFQKEMRLAQAEFTEKIKGGVQASVWVMVAGLLGLVTFFILIQAAIFAKRDAPCAGGIHREGQKRSPRKCVDDGGRCCSAS